MSCKKERRGANVRFDEDVTARPQAQGPFVPFAPTPLGPRLSRGTQTRQPPSHLPSPRYPSFQMTDLQHILRGIADRVNVFLEEFDVAGVATAAPSSSKLNEDLIPPISWFTGRLQSLLKALPLDESLRQQIINIFTELGQARRLQVLERATSALQSLVSLEGTSEQQDLYIKALQSQYSRRTMECIQVLYDSLKKRFVAYQVDVDSAASTAESSSESDDGDGCPRGHRPAAVMILERAYAHAQNITQAEKRKLAELTGLQPRQVVIWFQNRRNRKVKTQRRSVLEVKQEDDAAAASPPASRKRQRDHDEREDDSQPPPPPYEHIKRPRTTALATPPPMFDRRLFSSSSSGSLASSVDSGSSLLSWHRDQRQPDASSETTFSSPLSSNSPASVWHDSPCKSRSTNTAAPFLGPNPVLLAPSGETYIFQDEETNVPQLGFEELQLDPQSLNENLKLSFDGLAAGTQPGLVNGWQRSDVTNCTPGLAGVAAGRHDQDKESLMEANAFGLALTLSGEHSCGANTLAPSAAAGEDSMDGLFDFDFSAPDAANGSSSDFDFSFGLDLPFCFSPKQLGLPLAFDFARQAFSDVEAEMYASYSSCEMSGSDTDGDAEVELHGTTDRRAAKATAATSPSIQGPHATSVAF
ncbi:hypothetical protein BDZ90DRAFT_186819 [Jaminaea rosea]|uniref:Homeobox domain-containing protein n=1 Tax=Jaminaea rosea TaxID=1569628 RepID=A0A316UPB2_9BASI|nr:hypothetical protein BDZ90DRAFT_186819 [Jaminaea rosea]PWN27136.1 hypothetical protein BDZ90DRAFT_186819 [Jaminaea rosea]